MDFRHGQKEEEPGLVTSLHVKGDGERGELGQGHLRLLRGLVAYSGKTDSELSVF